MLIAKKTRFRLALLLSVVAIGGLWRLSRNQPSLLERARCIVITQRPSYVTDSYTWLNDNEYLYLAPTQQTDAYQIRRRNIVTGSDAAQDERLYGGMQLSPNGLWSLTYKPARNGWQLVLKRTDGSRRLEYFSPAYASGGVAWMPDGSALVELLPPSSAQGIAQSGLLRAYSLGAPAPVTSRVVEGNTPNYTALGALPNHHVLLMGFSYRVPFQQMLDCPPERGLAAHPYRIPLPPNAQCVQTALSPQGDRIAWLYLVLHKPPSYLKLRQMYNLLHIFPSYTAAIWISKPDGSDLHEFGTLPTNAFQKAGAKKGESLWPINLRWTPNGKQLSFMYQHNLYIVPVL